jgi:hypothetical protein
VTTKSQHQLSAFRLSALGSERPTLLNPASPFLSKVWILFIAKRKEKERELMIQVKCVQRNE